MRILITFCLSLFVCVGIHAQTTIYSQNFNTGSATDWSLNTSDLGGVATGTGNQWLINNVYVAGSLGTATANEPSGIIGYPTSYYMHMNCGSAYSGFYGLNCNFLAGGTGQTYFAALNAPISTTGYTNVYFSFWWLCNGDASCVGKVYYRTSATGTWTQITSPTSNFYGSSAWALDSFHLAAFDNQASLEFGFQFTDGSSSGNDPAFGIDDISVTGTAGVVAPVATYTTTATTACQDSCITFTSTTTGTIDSVRWTTLPTTSVVIASPTANVTSICFHAAGTYSVTLTAHNSGGTNAVTHVITINPAPHVVITKSGHLLTATGGPFSSYQWEKNATSITGATTSTYTYSVAATYNVVVDSGGCKGTSNTISTLGVPVLNGAGNSYWLAQTDNNTINLFAAGALDETLNVTIYDATGRKILNDIWNAGSNTKQISAGFFPPGLYIIRLSNNNTSTVLRFVK